MPPYLVIGVGAGIAGAILFLTGGFGSPLLGIPLFFAALRFTKYHILINISSETSLATAPLMWQKTSRATIPIQATLLQQYQKPDLHGGAKAHLATNALN